MVSEPLIDSMYVLLISALFIDLAQKSLEYFRSYFGRYDDVKISFKRGEKYYIGK